MLSHLFCRHSLIIGICLSGCKGEQTEPTVSTFALPTGEVITNKSFISEGRDRVCHNQLSYQDNASSPSEVIGEVVEEDAGPLSLKSSTIIRDGRRTALILGSQIFQRWPRKEGPYWYHFTATPDPCASVYLRSFLPVGDNRASVPLGQVRGWFNFPRPEVPYVFENLDLKQNVFVTRRDTPDATFPEFLVYSAQTYGFPWSFDIERTRAANGAETPLIEGISIEYSVITYNGDVTLADNRVSALKLPQAKEIHASENPIRATSWDTLGFSFVTPQGKLVTERHDAMIAFRDSSPDYISIFWRRHPITQNHWFFVKIGEWTILQTSGFEGDFSRTIYFRIKHKESD